MIRNSANVGTASDRLVQEALSEMPPWTGGKASEAARKAACARNNSGRRRRVDPTTCERDYSPAEIEFLQAMQDYKKSSGRNFPTWSEVLEVLHGLGYHKPTAEPSWSSPPRA